jgi:hypothetical protein
MPMVRSADSSPSFPRQGACEKMLEPRKLRRSAPLPQARLGELVTQSDRIRKRMRMGDAGPLAVLVRGNVLEKHGILPLILSFSRNLALARLLLRVAISARGYGRGEGTLLLLLRLEQSIFSHARKRGSIAVSAWVRACAGTTAGACWNFRRLI